MQQPSPWAIGVPDAAAARRIHLCVTQLGTFDGCQTAITQSSHAAINSAAIAFRKPVT